MVPMLWRILNWENLGVKIHSRSRAHHLMGPCISSCPVTHTIAQVGSAFWNCTVGSCTSTLGVWCTTLIKTWGHDPSTCHPHSPTEEPSCLSDTGHCCVNSQQSMACMHRKRHLILYLISVSEKYSHDFEREPLWTQNAATLRTGTCQGLANNYFPPLPPAL